MAKVSIEPGNCVRTGAAAMGISVASDARDAGIAGLEFLRGLPGKVAGAVRKNAGAYGREADEITIDCTVVLRDGPGASWKAEDINHSDRQRTHPKGASGDSG